MSRERPEATEAAEDGRTATPPRPPPRCIDMAGDESVSIPAPPASAPTPTCGSGAVKREWKRACSAWEARAMTAEHERTASTTHDSRAVTSTDQRLVTRVAEVRAVAAVRAV